MADILNPFDEAKEKRLKNKKQDTGTVESEKKSSPAEETAPAVSSDGEKTDKGNITAVEKMIEKLLLAQTGFSKQIDGIVSSVNDIKEQQQFTNKSNEERFRMLENQKRQFLMERQRKAMEGREGFNIPERPASPLRRDSSDYEDGPGDDYEDGPDTKGGNDTEFDEKDYEPADNQPNPTEDFDENDYVEADGSEEAGDGQENPSDDVEDGPDEGDAGEAETDGSTDSSNAASDDEDDEEAAREAKRRNIKERKVAREAMRNASPATGNTDNTDGFEEEEYIETPANADKNKQVVAENEKVQKQVKTVDNTTVQNVLETQKWLKDEEADYTLQRMQALAANIKGTVTSATKMNDELRITLEEVRKENQNLTDIALRMEKILQNFLEIQSNSVDLNDKVTRTVSYARDVFQKEYAETLAATSTSACSQFLSESRKKYEELFDKAVKNFKQFSDAAVSWQKEIESKSNKKLDRVSKVSMASPVLLAIVIILQIYIITRK